MHSAAWRQQCPQLANKGKVESGQLRVFMDAHCQCMLARSMLRLEPGGLWLGTEFLVAPCPAVPCAETEPQSKQEGFFLQAASPSQRRQERWLSEVIVSTQAWLREFVAGEGLCPWALGAKAGPRQGHGDVLLWSLRAS